MPAFPKNALRESLAVVGDSFETRPVHCFVNLKLVDGRALKAPGAAGKGKSESRVSRKSC